MTSYIKAAICAGLISIYALTVILLIGSDSTSGDDKAYLFFKESNYKMAFAFTEELEKDSNSYKYPLFQGYILREDKNIEKSTFFFKKALKPHKIGKNFKELLEIHLNLAFNAYLQNDLKTLKDEMLCLKQLQNSNKNLGKSSQYIDLFKGIEALLEKDHEKALAFFQKHQTFFSLSPWMKCSFEKQFTKIFLEFQIIHCLIETNRFNLAHQMLDNNQKIKLTHEELDSIYFLKAYIYLKEYCNTPFKNETNYLLELKKIKNKEIIVNKFKANLLELEQDFFNYAKTNDWNRFSHNFAFLDEIFWIDNVNSCSSCLSKVIDQKLALKTPVEALNLINKTDGDLHVKLLYNVSEMMKKKLREKDFEKLVQHIHLNKSLNSDCTFTNDAFVTEIADFSLEMVLSNKDKIESILSCINLWKPLEKSQANKVHFAKKLVNSAKVLWLVEKEYNKATMLFEAAYEIPENKTAVLEALETTVSFIHKKAVKEDLVHEYFHILHIVKTLKLKAVNIYDEQEKNQLLDDASYFFSRSLYDKAYERASFVVAIDPHNKEACKIAGLSAFELGNFAIALNNLKLIQNPSPSILKILKIIEPKPN